MTAINAHTAEPDAVADERRLDLLRRIADAGGRITPNSNPQAEHGYEYHGPYDGYEGDLQFLARRDYLEERFFDRVSLCPKCASHHLNVREICPGCRRAHLANEGLLHHFRCGYVGRLSEFTTVDDGDGSRLCPKCNRKLHHLGTEYDRLGKAFVCRECGFITENPPVEAFCLACGARTLAEDLVSQDVFSYVLTSFGSAAIRRGSLLDSDNELVFIAGAPVYRRSVILEFLDHEMKRLRHFKSGFALLFAEYSSQAMDDRKGSPESWLTRLRQCLREVDLIGQLADAVFVVILPQTKQRAAEALRHRIVAELGPQLPWTLSAIEITEPMQLAQILAHRSAVREPA
jgi:Thaumarchaeal output domain 1